MKEVIFYIVIGVFIFLVSMFRGKKKPKPQQRAVDFSNNPGEPKQQEAKIDPHQFLSQFQDMFTNDDDEIIPRYNQETKPKPEEKKEAPKPEPEPKKKKEEKPQKSEFDLKSAIIYSEILNRKYE